MASLLCLLWLALTLTGSLAHPSLLRSPPKLFLISFDGFHPSLISPTLTPTLHSLATSGVTGRMRSSFPTKTFPNHHSMATGRYQPYHGVVNNKFTDPTTNEYFDVANSSHFWWDMFGDNVPLYIANQVYGGGRYSGAIQWPGSISSYTGGLMEEPELDHDFARHRHRVRYLIRYNRDLNLTAAIDLAIDGWFLARNRPANFVCLYFPEPDMSGHTHGPSSPQVGDKVAALDQAIGHLLDRLHETHLDEEMNLIVLSDHGMSEIKSVIYLEDCSTLQPGLAFHLIGVSPVYSVVPLARPKNAAKVNTTNSSLVTAVQLALNDCSKRLFNSSFTVYRPWEIPAEFHYGANRRILDLFLLGADGYEIKHTRAAGEKVPRGNHGFNNSLPAMRPLFIAHGPAFKERWSHPQKFENVDLYPLLLELLGIPRELFPSNGTFERVKGMLRDEEEDAQLEELEIDEDQLPETEGDEAQEEAKAQAVLEFILFCAITVLMLFFSFCACVAKWGRRRRGDAGIVIGEKEAQQQHPTTPYKSPMYYKF